MWKGDAFVVIAAASMAAVTEASTWTLLGACFLNTVFLIGGAVLLGSIHTVEVIPRYGQHAKS